MTEYEQSIDGLLLMQTCFACPEQYDVIDPKTNKTIGYLRLRHGFFTVECPDVGGTLVYQAYTEGDGAFTDRERSSYLNIAVQAIKEHYKLTKKYVVALGDIQSGTNTQWVIEAESSLEATIFAVRLLGYEVGDTEYKTFEEFRIQCMDWELLVSVITLP